jgi:hypothetical protein
LASQLGIAYDIWTVMRSLASAVVVGTLLASTPAPAQIYDPTHPVCMHVYGEEMGDRMDCIFISLAQCAASAFGLPATCLINPYYASERKATPIQPNRRRAW